MIQIFICFLACAPDCSPWSAIPIDTREADSPSEAQSSVEDSINRIADWTGRPESCVSGVQSVDTLELDGRPMLGQYDSQTREILLQGDLSQSGVARVSVHEFCHAIDYELDSISEANPDRLSTVSSSISAEIYPSEVLRLHEAFAGICEQGPQGAAVIASISDSCGLNIDLTAQEFVEETLFQSSSVLVHTADLTVDTAELTHREGNFLAGSIDAVPAQDVVLAIDWTVDDSGWIEPQVMFVDGGQVVAATTLDRFEQGRDSFNNPTLTSGSLLGSTSGAVLRDRQTEIGLRISLVDGAIQTDSIDLPLLPVEPRGFEKDGDWFVVGEMDSAPTAVLILDGVSQVIDYPSSHGETSGVSSFYADDRGALVAWESNTGLAVQAIDWRGEVSWHTLLALPGSRVSNLTRSSDGRVLMDVYTSEADVGLSYSPESDSWSLLNVPKCTEIGDGWMLQDQGSIRLRWEHSASGRSIMLETAAYESN